MINELEKYYAELIEKSESGHAEPLEAYLLMRKAEELTKQAIKEIYGLAKEDVYSYPEKTFTKDDYEITKKNLPGRWEYKHIDQHNKKKEELKEIEENAKTAYKTKGAVATEEGEVIEAAKYTPGAESFSVKKIK